MKLDFTSSFARSATSPSFAYVSNPAPDSSLCRAAAPRLTPLQLLLPDCIEPLQLLLPVCVRFSYCSPLASASAAAPRLWLLLAACVRFSCCPDCFYLNCSSSPIASASAAAPRLHPLQLLLSDCVRFNCCSPSCSGPCPIFSNILSGVQGSVN